MRTIGVDIGGTNIKASLFDGEIIINSVKEKTNGTLGNDYILASLFSCIDNLLNSSKIKPEYIGISSAGNINPYDGTCVYASNNLKGWTGLNIKNVVENKYNIKCYVENDAVCAFLAEFEEQYNQFQGKNVVMITIGTGLGICVYHDNKIIRGNNFDGGAFAHKVVRENGIYCDCGKFGCAEKEL